MSDKVDRYFELEVYIKRLYDEIDELLSQETVLWNSMTSAERAKIDETYDKRSGPN